MEKMQINKFTETKLITITRKDISDGYQVVQTAHCIADFAYEFPTKFKDWKEDTNSIVCLSVKDEEALLKLFEKLSKLTPCSKFYEPDVNAYTAICVYGTPEIRKSLSHLPLVLRQQKPKQNDKEGTNQISNGEQSSR